MADELAKLFAPGYRHGETLPSKFNLSDLNAMARAAQLGKQNGMPAWGQDQLLNKILLEGRGDAGTNEYNQNNKNAVFLRNSVLNAAQTPEQAIRIYNHQPAMAYPAAVLDKDQTAQRFGISRERAWNGTGKNGETGRTGAQHAARAEQHKGAQNDPRNAELKDFMDRAAKQELTPRENLAVLGGNRDLFHHFKETNYNDLKHIERFARDTGNTFDDPTKQELLNPLTLTTAYLRRSGIELPKRPYNWEAPEMRPNRKGSPTYSDRMAWSQQVDQLNRIEKIPGAKAYLDERLGVTPNTRPVPVRDKIEDWMEPHIGMIRNMFTPQE